MYIVLSPIYVCFIYVCVLLTLTCVCYINGANTHICMFYTYKTNPYVYVMYIVLTPMNVCYIVLNSIYVLHI